MAKLLRRAGRAVTQNRAISRTAMVGAMGAAAVSGVGGAMTDSGGVWQQEVFPNAQELAFGNPRMAQESVRAGVTAAMTMDADEDVMRPGDYYYSRPVNLRRNDSLGIPVSGEMVFGMYNLRR